MEVEAYFVQWGSQYDLLDILGNLCLKILVKITLIVSFLKTYKPSLTAPSLPGSRRKKATTYTRKSHGSSLKRNSTRVMLGSWGLILPGCTIAHDDFSIHHFTSLFPRAFLKRLKESLRPSLFQKLADF